MHRSLHGEDGGGLGLGGGYTAQQRQHSALLADDDDAPAWGAAPAAATTSSAAAAAAAAVAPAPALADEWVYKDPQGVVQGPFARQDIVDW